MGITRHRLNRREALIGAGLVGGGSLAAFLLSPTVGEASDTESAEGVWLVHVVPDDGSAAHNVLYLVAQGGAIAAVSDNPPSSGTTGFGVWGTTSDRRLVSTFEQFEFTPSGDPAGILRVRTLGSVDQLSDELSGTATLDFQPAGSSTFLPAGTTRFTGTRIKVLP